jgi:hypothetical protein
MSATAALGPGGVSAQYEVSGKVIFLGNARPQHRAQADDPQTLAIMYMVGAETAVNGSVGYTVNVLTVDLKEGAVCMLRCSP